MKRTPGKVVVQFFPGNMWATTWWLNSQVLFSTLCDGHIPEYEGSRLFLRKYYHSRNVGN